MSQRASIVLGVVAGSLLACSDTGPGQDATVPDTGVAPQDSGPDSATCTPSPAACATPAMPAGVVSGCYTASSTCPVCPSTVQNAPDLGSFRIINLGITAPRGLANMTALHIIINNSLARGEFLWGITMDYTANTLRTGALNMASVTRGTLGQGVLDGTFAYHRSDAPVMQGDAAMLDPGRWNDVVAPLSLSGGAYACSPFTMRLRVPVYNPPSGPTVPDLLTELPLTAAYMHDVRLSPDRNCIGVNMFTAGRYNECTGARWQMIDDLCRPWGVLEADITVAEARVQTIPLLNNTSLCNIMAGLSGMGTSSCDGTPMERWPNQPDTMVNGQPAYHMRASFAAIGATIRNAR